jgi:hypothetical protein
MPEPKQSPALFPSTCSGNAQAAYRACRWPSLSRPCPSMPVPKQSPVPLDLLGERTIRRPSLSVAELVEAMSVKAGAEAIPCPVPLDLLGERASRMPSLSVAELVDTMSVKAGAEAIPCSPRPARGTHNPQTEPVGGRACRGHVRQGRNRSNPLFPSTCSGNAQTASRACRWPSLSRPCPSRPEPKQSPALFPSTYSGNAQSAGRACRWPSLSRPCLSRPVPTYPLFLSTCSGNAQTADRACRWPGCSQNIGKQENIKPGYNDNLILTAIRSALLPLLFPLKDTP